jgi:hypothetical protein
VLMMFGVRTSVINRGASPKVPAATAATAPALIQVAVG